MKASGSKECRNCHNFNSMDAREQKPKARKMHAEKKLAGETCVDRDKGIAHFLPKGCVDTDE